MRLRRRILERPRAIPYPGARDPDGLLLRGRAPGALVRASGPYVVCGGWWSGREVHREYYFAEMQGGHLLWVFFDATRRKWFLHGQVE